MPICSPFHTSFLILLAFPHGEAFESDVLTLVHISFAQVNICLPGDIILRILRSET